MRVGVLIPAYNESKKIGDLTQSLKSMGFLPVVVDDGSKDGTAEEAEAGGAKVIRHRQNLGKGRSLKTGFDYMSKENYDAIIIMDGDGQHSPKDIHKFIDTADKNRNSIIVGNRMDDTKNMPFDRKLTNMFMSFIMSLVCGQKVPDSQCGFRLIRRELFTRINIESLRFEIESEILFKASRAGARILSVPIKTLYGKESSEINPFLDAFRFVVFLIKLPFIK